MLKSLYINLSHYLGRIILFFLILLSTVLFAENKPNIVIITGQIINYEYGNPVEGHMVNVEKIDGTSDRYSNEIFTDKEGYYHDTIVTTLNKGSFKITTNDYEGKLIDTIVHFRFLNYVAFDVIIANFKIYMPFQSEKLQARFEYFQKNGDSRFRFKFMDLTASENIISWKWNFGDGNTSNSQNPTHVYKDPGVFKVSFTVTTNDNNITESNTITSLIYISERSFYHMGGHAFSYYFPIDVGLAYLYIIDSNEQYIPVDTVKFDTLGFYIFYQLPVGNYVVKTQPDSESEFYGDMMPTYYGDKMFWAEAEIIHLTNTNWEYDIHLMNGHGMNSGNCLLNGNVVYNDLGLSLMELPAKNVDIYIFDDNEQLLGSHYSNEDGFFDFSNLSTGTYWIYPEVTGYDADPLRIVLSNEEPISTGIQIIIGPTGPDFIFDNQTEADIITNVYPNPASSEINIEFDNKTNDNLTIDIFDLQGRLVFSEKLDNYNKQLSVNISSLQSGTYVLIVSNGNLQARQVFVVEN